MKTLTTTLLCTVLLLGACKKPKNGTDGAPGPQGPPGIVPTTSEGFIKGTITGTHRDGSPMNKSFNFTNYWGEPSATVDSTDSGYMFEISRGTDILSYSSAYLYFTLPTLAATTVTFSSMSVSYSEPMGNNTYLSFQAWTGKGTITNFSYDKASGIFKGNYSLSLDGYQNNTENPAQINGSFEAKGSRLYYRTFRETTDIAPEKAGESSGQ